MNQIHTEHNASPAKLEVMGVFDWPIWRKDVSTFPWTYEQTETCYFLQGKVEVTPENATPITLGEGDLVVFPKGMTCTWNILEAVEKHYNFA